MQIVYWVESRLIRFLSGHLRAREWVCREHVWEPWEDLAPYSCEQRKICRRCFRRESRVVHRWDTWEADRHVSHVSVVRCSRCEAVICPELQLPYLLAPVPFP